MAVRRNTGARRAPAKAAPVARTRKPAPAPVSRKRDVTEYAEKPATPYHKAFAKWIVTEVGFDPDAASSKRAAFLKGVSIATAARPAFNQSDFIDEWREASGESKRGPKPKAEEEEAPRTRRRKPAPEPESVEEDDEFEDDDEFDDDASDEDDFEDDDSDDESDDEDEFEDDEEEEAPAPKRRGRPAKAASASVRPTRGGAATPKTARGKAKPAPDDDEFLF